MTVRFGPMATSWTCLFRVAGTGETVAVGSWTDPRSAAEWGHDGWFAGRARFEGLVPLVSPEDFTHQLTATNRDGATR